MARTVILFSDDIGCEHCAMTIEKALRELVGVETVHVDVDTKAIRITATDETVLAAAKALLPSIGYAVRD